jgi:hypothetical protein
MLKVIIKENLLFFRLFVMCGKHITEEQFRDAFEPFGVVEEVWVLKDRVTQEPKVRPILTKKFVPVFL